MPSYLDMLPEDIITHVYRMLYKSILNDMKKDTTYKNIPIFHKLLEITKNPYIDNLNYYDFVVSSCIDNIVEKYKYYEIEYDEDMYYNKLLLYNYSLYNTSLYYKSYYIKPLDIDINKIELSNFFIYNLYNNDNNGISLFNNTYFADNNFRGIIKKANKNGFILEKVESFRCLAELLYYIIDFYDFIKQILYMNIHFIEQMSDILNLSREKTKERDFLIDVLNFHSNHRYIEELIYDIDNNCVNPQLE
jgi:hypothetical protein